MKEEVGFGRELRLAQITLALLLPWLVAHVLVQQAPLIHLAALVAVIGFAFLHRADRRLWLVPLTAALSVLPEVPAWLSAGVGLSVLVVFVLRPMKTEDPSRLSGRIVAAAVMLTLAATLIVMEMTRDSVQMSQYQIAQEQARDQWDNPVVGEPATENGASETTTTAGKDTPSIAVMRFQRPGSATTPVTDQELFVGDGIGPSNLEIGPGHYPETSLPGQSGNFAVAGHSSSFGAPFAKLDQLREGDQIVIRTQDKTDFTYLVTKTAVVEPNETWVITDDPLGIGQPTITLTTCYPPGDESKRLIVWGVLADEAVT